MYKAKDKNITLMDLAYSMAPKYLHGVDPLDLPAYAAGLRTHPDADKLGPQMSQAVKKLATHILEGKACLGTPNA